MKSSLILAKDANLWREALSLHSAVDVCHTPEYHLAYEDRTKNGQALLLHIQDGAKFFSYPFILAPIKFSNFRTENNINYYDISSVYGFSGPLLNTENDNFKKQAWEEVDRWARENNVVCEFVRFSVFLKNHLWAHSECKIEINRPISYTLLKEDSDEQFKSLPSKTQNMIRRAQREGFTSRILSLEDGLTDFIELYEKTMNRNGASNFFYYGQKYYDYFLKMPKEEVVLSAVFKDSQMVSAAIGLKNDDYVFYHLGASLKEASRLGAGNLVLFELSMYCLKKKLRFFNVGGGRTSSLDDPLFRFKKNNGTGVTDFYIGKRIIDNKIYENIKEQWMELNPNVKPLNLQFYR